MTDTGRYHIAFLRLNRIELIRHRLREQEIGLVARERDILISLVADYRELVDAQVEIRNELAAATTPKKRSKKRR